MELTFASYNIRKAVGIDGRRDPDRILSVLREIDADVIALQEADRRFGLRESTLPLAAILDHSPWRPVALNQRPHSLGWHGNALLVRRTITVADASIVPLPMLEPRGAVRADLEIEGLRFRVAGMHLDISGLRRRHQMEAIVRHLGGCQAGPCPTVLLGDFNEWNARGSVFRAVPDEWQVLGPGRSFPSRRPLAQLDRIVASPEWQVVQTGVHHSQLAAGASDHLPVHARMMLPKN